MTTVMLLAETGTGGMSFLPLGPYLLLVMLLLVGTGIWLVVYKARGGHRAREILAERYARGEISPEEYQQRRRDLR